MRFDNWIAGDWAGSEDRIENINPSDTHDVIGHYAQANFDDLERAVISREGALIDLKAASPLYERSRLLWMERVELWAVLPPDLDQVAEALVRHERRWGDLSS